MAKKVLLITDDSNLKMFTDISVQTLTKLNHFTILETRRSNEIKEIGKPEGNTDLLILDSDYDFNNLINYIKLLRFKDDIIKIITLFTNISEAEKKKIFEAGCDVIMSKEEFQHSINNILQF